MFLTKFYNITKSLSLAALRLYQTDGRTVGPEDRQKEILPHFFFVSSEDAEGEGNLSPFSFPFLFSSSFFIPPLAIPCTSIYPFPFFY